MAEIEISLKFNRRTGKKDIVISYESDEDALPIEHEEEHQRIVRRLLDQGVLEAEEMGDIHVERITGGPATSGRQADESPQAEGPLGGQ